MNIVIVGGGRIGKALAVNLQKKQHSVVVVEKDPHRAKELANKLNILVINEDGVNMATLEKAKIKSADIFVAVTQIDELNLMACMMAKRAEVSTTVALIRNPESHSIADTGFSKEEIGVNYVINPERAVAFEISKMINYPEAAEVEYYSEEKVMLVSTVVRENAKMVGRNLEEISLPKGCVIVGIKRANDDFIVPSGNDNVEVGDKVYLIGDAQVMRKASWLLHHKEPNVRRVVILGGGNVGFMLASNLENDSKQKYQIKLIEKDESRYEELKRKLKKTVIILGDSTEWSYFNQEEIAEADVLVAVTGDDRTNIIAAIMGDKLGVQRTISEIANNDYSYIYDTVGIVNYVNPHLITAYSILRFAHKGELLNFSHLREEYAEVLEVVVPESCEISGKKVADADFPKGMVIGTITRDGEIIIPDGDTVLEPNDDLVIFTRTNISYKLDKYFCPV